VANSGSLAAAKVRTLDFQLAGSPDPSAMLAGVRAAPSGPNRARAVTVLLSG
jgi:hypothetical protein